MNMNTYTQWLDLEFDPFAPSATSRDFYCSGHRQQILDQIVELSLYSNAMIAITGPLGAGKTTLAANFCNRFAEEAVCVKVAATLFMNQNQFLEALQDPLGFKPAINSDIDAAIEQICRYAAELDLEARSLILIIDDAHELSAEVLQLLTSLLERCVDSSIHALLFGEKQLDSLLQSTLTADAQERLAVFPLEGFASDETQEYIRFKLATASFSKELPLSGGIIGGIHNSSQGMPGAINNMVADALNSAAPVSEIDNFADMAPMFSGERIEALDEGEELDEFHGYATEVDDDEESEQGWIGSIQPGYWAVAACLVLLLGATLLFWDSAPPESETIPIAVSVTPASTPVVEPEPVVEVVAAVPEILASDTQETTPVTTPVEDQAEVVAAVATIEPEVTPVEVVAPVVEPVVIVEPAEIAAASPFVESLLESAPTNFAVQLLASHSEANISEFIAQLGSDHPAGYFETRYQGKPWFVAVLGAFDDRDKASRAIASLPAKLRSNEPWIRSVAGIQADIRELLGSNLVSAK
ncbi:MAG: hypothetical protein DHS20C12_17310 [Pseudohongiella sp.]|nr:MAG: hypothetical protein DHS20C12_17310 [Pseudohongiella sp.]